MGTLWIRFLDEPSIPVEVCYDERERERFATFDAFKENYIRGWSGTDENPKGTPVEYCVQEKQPDENTVWLRAPEFAT